ncbi:LysR family transcriptional regulator [Halomonas sp. GT]|uniref:LysR substrate-binding domain-containing protein n=1 Tax=Halomonas sp. GT TaxID=1971364 RepID=UPI0009F55147|nr:LysR family transcriptional regulator [Halomonas sp. GT]
MNQLLAMRTFIRVLETGSFSRASEQLALPRSTISKLISDLETHLGTKLLNRTTRNVAATMEGMEYYKEAFRLIEDMDAVDNAMRANKYKPQGHIRVDAPATFATQLLIPALADFQHHYPDITVALGISDRAVNIIREGVDCVIRAGRLDDLAMVGRHLVELDYVTCASLNYIEKYGIPHHPRELETKHTLLGYFTANTSQPMPIVLEKGSERFEMSGGSYSANDGNGLLAMMLADLGIGQHFVRCLQPYIDNGKIVPILTDWTRPRMEFHILYPPNRHQSTRLKVFIEWLLATFNDSHLHSKQ